MTKLSQYTHIGVSKEALTDNKIFNKFKSIPAYTKILEHTTKSYGSEYIGEIFNNYSEYAKQLDWEKLKENDTLGSPNIVDFPELKKHINIRNTNYSPSTIYYIYRGLDIIDKQHKKGENMRILEIGGGYGGQCKLILDMCDMLNITVEKYGIIDLEYASKLQEKYLSNFNYSNVEYFEYEHIADFDKFKEYNKVVAIYSLSELEVDVQNFYIDNIIKNISNYYILCNVEINNKFFANCEKLDVIPKVNRYHQLIIK